jgi:rhomboid family protein
VHASILLTSTAGCTLVFLWQSSLGDKAGEMAIYQYGMIPARLFGVVKLRSHLAAIPAWATVLTSMFMHGGWLHLGLNMLFLWIFGDNVEDSMGHSPFLLFYLLCGVAAAVAQAVMNPGLTLPMVGASGAISGVLGAYLRQSSVKLLQPRHSLAFQIERRRGPWG